MDVSGGVRDTEFCLTEGATEACAWAPSKAAAVLNSAPRDGP